MGTHAKVVLVDQYAPMDRLPSVLKARTASVELLLRAQPTTSVLLEWVRPWFVHSTRIPQAEPRTASAAMVTSRR